MFNLNDFLIAAESVRHMAPPVSEVRMHPDDIRELQEHAKPFLQYPCSASLGNKIMGINIIEDVNAQRLPRRPTTAQPDPQP